MRGYTILGRSLACRTGGVERTIIGGASVEEDVAVQRQFYQQYPGGLAEYQHKVAFESALYTVGGLSFGFILGAWVYSRRK